VQPNLRVVGSQRTEVHVKRIPPRPDLGHLKKQAKELLALYRSGDPAAIARFRDVLPAAAGKTDPAVAGLGLRLHDAQSCVAREYGLASWADLKGFVLARNSLSADPARAVFNWLAFVYAGDIAGGMNRAKPSVAARLLEESPGLLGDDPYLACAIGDEALLRRTIEREPAWIHRAGGPLQLSPLVAVTHSALVRLSAFRERLRACARLLIDAGADPNQTVGSRWPPASLSAPSVTLRLSALYGAAGQNHDTETTKLLLRAGADPNDGESLYHSLENLACTSLLWAIRRRRSPAHIEALLAAGADSAARTRDGATAYTLALRFGLPEVAQLLRQTGGEAHLPPAEQFIAACARGDEAAAGGIRAEHPQVISTLSESQLRQLSELASQGCSGAVKLMVKLGWPVAAPGGDWSASALNQAVFRGDAPLARFLLEHGASWTEQHGYGDNVSGTLS